MRTSNILGRDRTPLIDKSTYLSERGIITTLNNSKFRRGSTAHERKIAAHASRHWLVATAALTTESSPAGRLQDEREIAEALVQADVPYTTHSWLWRGHKVNYAVGILAPVSLLFGISNFPEAGIWPLDEISIAGLIGEIHAACAASLFSTVTVDH